jgi:hypothetical protein
MKCKLLQAGQDIDSYIWSGKGGSFSSSHVWTFMPVLGHRNMTFAMPLYSENRNLQIDQHQYR